MKRHRITLNQTAFLEAYRLTASLTQAAAAAEVDRRQHYRWMKSDAYAEEFTAAQTEAAQALEDEAVRRAKDGVEEPCVFQGEFTFDRVLNQETGEYERGKQFTVNKKSDSLLMFLLKGFKPEKYRDRGSLEVTGAGGGPLEIVERLNAARTRLAAQKKRDA